MSDIRQGRCLLTRCPSHCTPASGHLSHTGVIPTLQEADRNPHWTSTHVIVGTVRAVIRSGYITPLTSVAERGILRGSAYAAAFNDAMLGPTRSAI